jgi:hypothetical protein
MKKLWWVVVALAISAGLNTVAVMVGRGTYEHIMFVLHGILFVGVPAFVAGLILMIMGREKRWNLFLAGYALNLVSLVAGLMVVSAFVGLFIADRDVKETKEYCEWLVPQLEKYKQDKGQYPDDIDKIISRGLEPPLLLGSTFYSKAGDGYVMEFKDPSTRQRMVEYSSWKKQWQTHQ